MTVSSNNYFSQLSTFTQLNLQYEPQFQPYHILALIPCLSIKYQQTEYELECAFDIKSIRECFQQHRHFYVGVRYSRSKNCLQVIKIVNKIHSINKILKYFQQTQNGIIMIFAADDRKELKSYIKYLFQYISLIFKNNLKGIFYKMIQWWNATFQEVNNNIRPPLPHKTRQDKNNNSKSDLMEGMMSRSKKSKYEQHTDQPINTIDTGINEYKTNNDRRYIHQPIDTGINEYKTNNDVVDRNHKPNYENTPSEYEDSDIEQNEQKLDHEHRYLNKISVRSCNERIMQLNRKNVVSSSENTPSEYEESDKETVILNEQQQNSKNPDSAITSKDSQRTKAIATSHEESDTEDIYSQENQNNESTESHSVTTTLANQFTDMINNNINKILQQETLELSEMVQNTQANTNSQYNTPSNELKGPNNTPASSRKLRSSSKQQQPQRQQDIATNTVAEDSIASRVSQRRRGINNK